MHLSKCVVVILLLFHCLPQLFIILTQLLILLSLLMQLFFIVVTLSLLLLLELFQVLSIHFFLPLQVHHQLVLFQNELILLLLGFQQ